MCLIKPVWEILNQSILNLLKNHQFTVGVEIMDPRVWALTSSKPDGS